MDLPDFSGQDVVVEGDVRVECESADYRRLDDFYIGFRVPHEYVHIEPIAMKEATQPILIGRIEMYDGLFLLGEYIIIIIVQLVVLFIFADGLTLVLLHLLVSFNHSLAKLLFDGLSLLQ